MGSPLLFLQIYNRLENIMANRIPFTASFRIIPERGSGKRFEIQRSREKIAALVYEDLTTAGIFPNGNIAEPGGSVTWLRAGSDNNPSNNMSGVAVKPQFGETPDTLMVVGFYDGTVARPHGQVSVISGGACVSGPNAGPGASALLVTPTTAAIANANAIRAALLNGITSVSVTLISLEVSGIRYGHGGITLH